MSSRVDRLVESFRWQRLLLFFLGLVSIGQSSGQSAVRRHYLVQKVILVPICLSLFSSYFFWFHHVQNDRILALIEGILAANIFDWGSKACLELYREGTIIEIYKMSRDKMQRPWRVHIFHFLQLRMLSYTFDF